MDATLEGKTVLLTGAAGGIGRATALGLARLGAQVVMVGRRPAELEEAARFVRGASGTSRVEVLLADLSSQAQVRHLAGAFLERHRRLDVLIHNAGVTPGTRQTTEDGLELQFAVNYLAPFLLTRLLLDPLRAGGPSRVVNVASDASRLGRLDLDDLQSERGYTMLGAYARSKLAMLMFTVSLAERLDPREVTVNALDPGWIETPMTRGMEQGPGLLGVVNRVAQRLPFLRATPEWGAHNSLYLASSPEVAGTSGRFFTGRHRQTRLPRAASDPAVRQRLWTESERLAGLSPTLPSPVAHPAS